MKSVLSSSLIRLGFKFDSNFPCRVCSRRRNTKDPYTWIMTTERLWMRDQQKLPLNHKRLESECKIGIRLWELLETETKSRELCSLLMLSSELFPCSLVLVSLLCFSQLFSWYFLPKLNISQVSSGCQSTWNQHHFVACTFILSVLFRAGSGTVGAWLGISAQVGWALGCSPGCSPCQWSHPVQADASWFEKQGVGSECSDSKCPPRSMNEDVLFLCHAESLFNIWHLISEMMLLFPPTGCCCSAR